MDDSTTHSLSRTPQESKGFLGICSILCSPGHTASPAGDIAKEPDIPGACGRQPRSEQRGDRIGLIVPHLEYDPTIWHDVRNPRKQTMEEA
jgi:hypothetical protein